MPAVIGLDIVAALAFGMAAIVATVLVRQLIVSPIRASASGVSGIAVVGGALAWLLTNAANMIELGLNVFDWGQAQFRAQALAWWNYAVTQTAYYIGLPQRGEFNQVAANAASALFTANYTWLTYLPWLRGRVDANERNLLAATAAVQYVIGAALPELRGIEAGLRVDVNAAGRLAQQIWNTELPAIRGIEAGIRTDLNVTQRALADVQSHVIPRIQADVNARALQSDLQALRDVVTRQGAQLAILGALAILALAGEEAISNLRCHMDIPCSDLNQFTGQDWEARIAMLEVATG